ncbi:hypothetical protein [Vibrio diabolicus]|uniref:hypothetical protein n=1 Tax=Vibrio diabolicus TaxID=50719 RepID=UPI0014284801|nr:hypothetical protein [Vibrio diabolicus]QIR97492.1 hypothetical protein FR741_06860 [Vibrio diabolicus]
MNISEMNDLALKVKEEMPWISGITSDEQYQELNKLMESLSTDTDKNRSLTDLIIPILEQYELDAYNRKKVSEKRKANILVVLVLIGAFSFAYFV